MLLLLIAPEVKDDAWVVGAVQLEQVATPAREVTPVFVGSSQSFRRLAAVEPF